MNSIENLFLISLCQTNSFNFLGILNSSMCQSNCGCGNGVYNPKNPIPVAGIHFIAPKANSNAKLFILLLTNPYTHTG